MHTWKNEHTGSECWSHTQLRERRSDATDPQPQSEEDNRQGDPLCIVTLWVNGGGHVGEQVSFP